MMISEEMAKRDALVIEMDSTMEEVQRTGRLPQTWWASTQCWGMLAKLCGQLSGSSMVPSDYRKNPENVLVALTAGMPLGLSPIACLQSVAVINGKPTLYGDAPIAQVLAHKSLQSISEEITGTINDGSRCHSITIVRTLASGEHHTVTRTFGIADAKRAGLWGKSGPWTNYPDRMLYNRARALAVRDTFADVLSGVSLAADDSENVTVIQAEVRDTTAPETSVDQTDSLSSEVAPIIKKRKRRTKAEMLADAAKADTNDQDDAKTAFIIEHRDDSSFHAHSLDVMHWCESMDELIIGGVCVIRESQYEITCDAEAQTIHHCNGEGWREVKSDETALFESLSEFAHLEMQKRLTKHCLSLRLDQTEAMQWAQDELEKKDMPQRFSGLTLFELLELDFRTR